MDGKNCIADEHYLPTFFHVRIFLKIMTSTFWYFLSSPNEFFWLVLSDDWSWWYCQPVSYTCWLVWTEVASKIIQAFRCLLWSSEEYYGIFMLDTSIETIFCCIMLDNCTSIIAFLLSSFFFLVYWNSIMQFWWCYIYLCSRFI